LESWRQGRISVTPNDSSLWKAIAKILPNLELHRCWSIGDGCKVNFWTDKWFDEHTRFSESEANIPEAARRWMVKDVVLSTGEWNFHMIQSVIPHSLVQKLHAIVLPHASQGDDTPLWPGTSTRQFTVSSAYHLLTGENTTENEKKWKQILIIDSIERIKVFIWQLAHNRLLTKLYSILQFTFLKIKLY
jgi:hypothetical protein